MNERGLRESGRLPPVPPTTRTARPGVCGSVEVLSQGGGPPYLPKRVQEEQLLFGGMIGLATGAAASTQSKHPSLGWAPLGACVAVTCEQSRSNLEWHDGGILAFD